MQTAEGVGGSLALNMMLAHHSPLHISSSDSFPHFFFSIQGNGRRRRSNILKVVVGISAGLLPDATVSVDLVNGPSLL